MKIYSSKKISSKKHLLFLIACCYFSSTFGQLKINSSNNVGIGGEPEARFHIHSGDFRLGHPGIFNIDASGEIGGRFKILDNGNVGIGNTSTYYKLNVAGDILANGGLVTNFRKCRLA